MAICLDFELIEMVGTKARYRYGSCLHELDGVMEVDLYRLVNGEISKDTPMEDVVIRLNDNQGQASANRIFGKIYKHFMENHEYPQKGGYYA